MSAHCSFHLKAIILSMTTKDIFIKVLVHVRSMLTNFLPIIISILCLRFLPSMTTLSLLIPIAFPRSPSYLTHSYLIFQLEVYFVNVMVVILCFSPLCAHWYLLISCVIMRRS
jgi:hypothetical protein